ncbi:DUF2079 domain-containing protein [Microcoleus sp. PH2017_05_CCC_O_A]|uniref:DUF2079 domain-containing protein n=1 Tax=Microcoleus sp. PH2017_05_CCC_O_A TaxID=2798816 RepID=UPI001D2581A3|nr:DUF2079 domain-containing protein [Microcoleus sp. PH2017_05_CCC_O_A]MCC3439352.1 DUF2079 domain-containing protein [Microcoleus sp. PH2017_05_CCC_O_A]
MENGENFADDHEDIGVGIGENIEEGRSRLPSSLVWAIAIAATIFFACSSLRHALFQSTAFDLGIFDQAIYLLSQNQTPFSSLMGIHILGDHAAVIYYPLALLYKIYPDVHWLLLVQAVALSLGAWPSWSLARLAGLNQEESRAIALIYLLYPVVFNINLFDFHPEVIALPALLAAILAARLNKLVWFCTAILLVLSCKAVLSITVAAIGFWLFVCEKKQRFGAIALLLGVAWFLIASQKIIPYFSGSEVAGVGRYSYLGKSVLEIIINLILKPQLVLGKILSFDTFKYLFVLTLPVIWLLLPFSRKINLKYLTALIPAIPTLIINILSDLPFQRSLAYQYSVPIVPFLILAIIAKEQAIKNTNILNQPLSSAPNTAKLQFKNIQIRQLWLGMQLPKAMIIWSLIIFLLLGESKDFILYANRLDTWQATREAIAQVQPQSSILTDNRLAPHFAHRPTVKLLSQTSPQTNLAEFKYILLNLRHPWPDTEKIGNTLANQLKNDRAFQLTYHKKQVLLFKRIAD